MNRANLFNSIEERLNLLALRISKRAQLNLLDLNIHSENFFAELLNQIYGWKLKNLNALQQNAEAIDLQDSGNRFLAQVSSTSTKVKIESSLTKDLSSKRGWQFYFISIARDATDLRKQTYQNPHGLLFDPSKDILDVGSILRIIQSEPLDKLVQIEAFLRKEFPLVDSNRIESGLTAVINILAQEDLNISPAVVAPVFRIEDKIDVNDLQNEGKFAVQDYAIHHSRVEKIYSEFNKNGANKSLAIMGKLRQLYASHKASLHGDALFSAIIVEVISVVRSSANYQQMSQEELELYAKVLVVDAFVRCKIFNNPVEVSHASP